MKSLAVTILLVLAFAVPTLAGFKPSRSGGPSSSRGAGTRFVAPPPDSPVLKFEVGKGHVSI